MNEFVPISSLKDGQKFQYKLHLDCDGEDAIVMTKVAVSDFYLSEDFKENRVFVVQLTRKKDYGFGRIGWTFPDTLVRKVEKKKKKVEKTFPV